MFHTKKQNIFEALDESMEQTVSESVINTDAVMKNLSTTGNWADDDDDDDMFLKDITSIHQDDGDIEEKGEEVEIDLTSRITKEKRIASSKKDQKTEEEDFDSVLQEFAAITDKKTENTIIENKDEENKNDKEDVPIEMEGLEMLGLTDTNSSNNKNKKKKKKKKKKAKKTEDEAVDSVEKNIDSKLDVKEAIRARMKKKSKKVSAASAAAKKEAQLRKQKLKKLKKKKNKSNYRTHT